MKNDDETRKIRIKNILVEFQRDAPPETAGVDIEKCVNEAFDFYGNRVVSDRDLLDICFLVILRTIEPLAREFLDSLKRAWALHPEIENLDELKRKHCDYKVPRPARVVKTPKSSLKTESPKSSTGLGIMTPCPPAEMLGPGYMSFASPFGVKGVARESTDRVDFVCLDARKGNFRAFIRHCQATYRTICVWEVWNHAIAAALRRHGFQQALESEQFSEFRGWRWDRNELTN
jgi:hypothetical protein